MKVVIIGGVAAGTKTAAKLKRESTSDEVIIYTKSEDISYAGCGLPYYIGGDIESEDQLTVNTPEKFSKLTGCEVHTKCEVTKVDPASKTVTVNGKNTVSYDKLVIAVGAEPVIPSIEGASLPGVFSVRVPADAVRTRKYAEEYGCRRAVIIGGGFIGLEVAENLKKKGLSVTIIDIASNLLEGVLDHEMADYVRRSLISSGVRVMTGTSIISIKGGDKVEGIRTTAGEIPADMAIIAAGIRPATGFLEDSGIDTHRGRILTDEYGATNLPDVYAVGDCAEVKNKITGKRQWSPMGSTANIMGRTLALNLSGEKTPYAGCLGTGIVKISEDLNAARTGLSESQAADEGYDTETVLCVSDDKAHYYPDSSFFITKLIADKASHKLLGAQILGKGTVDKMADIAVAGISLGSRVEDFLNMDFAYAPPFSTAIHPFAAACGILFNKLSGRFASFTPAEYADGAAKEYRIIDVHPAPAISGAEWFNLTKPEEIAEKYDKSEKLLLVCRRGRRAYMTQRKLRALGFENTRVLEGGAAFNVIKKTLPSNGKLPPEEIKRVKGLGCLQDKRYDDVFNVRVITVNGKITADEHRAVAEAAECFGSGEITMTSRLTLEIQGVPYENLDPLFAFLAQNGLETGGTGSLVRPVVSCKGTTCQYGLIDTFELSRKIHERFYKGYRGVTLPHKFKIAVGGCPNNCVKPDLNDLGVIGQRIPVFDFSKCRGCKKCQVETSCPIKVATVKDGMLNVDSLSCNGCGRCKSKCPFGVTEEYTNGYKIFIGGRWGKKIANGKPLDKIFTSEDEVLDIIERAILFFRDEGITGERLADTINRLGFDYAQEKLLNSNIDKSSILEKNVKGGASC